MACRTSECCHNPGGFQELLSIELLSMFFLVSITFNLCGQRILLKVVFI